MARKDQKKIFTEIYQRNHWKNGESVSGPGSTVSTTEEVRRQLPGILKAYNVKTMLDIPCGDFNWMKLVDLSGIRYTGGDIVEELVNKTQEQHGGPDTSFRVLNLLESDLPPVDIIMCRDCLVHFSHEDIAKAIDNMVRSGSRYLFTTTFDGIAANKPIFTGGWRPINLQLPPFNFPKPLKVVAETNSAHLQGKSMALYDLASLPGTKATD